MTQDLMPTTLDKHITNHKDDAFGHRHFALALRSLIESPRSKPPYSIGLLGSWGTGKSSIKELYISNLKDDAQKYNNKIRKNNIKCVTFNAWRFGGKDQDIKRALLRHVFIELGGTDEIISKALFCNVTDTIKKRYRFLEFCKESFFSSIYTLVPIIISITFCAFAIRLLNIINSMIISVLLIVVVGAFTIIFKRYRIHSLDPYYTQTVLQLPATSSERYEQLLQFQLSEFCNNKNEGYERIVVFVDDLDRLSAEEMVSGLDAVRTFMEMPLGNLIDKIGIIFVISCDETRVAEALGKRHKESDLPGAVFDSSDARRYLDRIFQFRLEIPPFPRQDMRSFALEKIRDLNLPKLDERIKSAATPLETLCDYMIHGDVQNPRNAIQIINAFSQAWWMACHRELEGVASERPGGLHENAVTGQPLILAILSAIKVNFPDFYKDLLFCPDLLAGYISVNIRGENADDQPYEIRRILINSYSISEGKIKRDLHRYIASLQGVRWPSTLQPYLFLSEDPTSRKFGGKWMPAYEDLVSSNKQGLLENLGIPDDSSIFSPSQVHILLLLFDKVKDASKTYKDNASKVVAELLSRIEDAQANSLIASLGREVCDSKELRALLGIIRITAIINRSEPIDKQAIVTELIRDVLKVDSEMDMLLETMQRPNMEESIAITRGVLDIALEVNSHYRLQDEALYTIRSWITNRTVKIQQNEYTFSFAEFDSWISRHEESLLRLLKQDYTQVLYEELSKNEPEGIDYADSLSRAEIIFGNLYAEGDESRAILWEQLISFAGLHHPGAVQLAWETALLHIDTPSQNEVSNFIVNLSSRMINQEDLPKSFKLTFPAAPTALAEIISRRKDAIDNNSKPDILAVINYIAGDNFKHSSAVACELLDNIIFSENEFVKNALNDWGQRLPHLADNATAYLFKNISILEGEMLAPVSNFLQTEIAAKTSFSDKAINAFKLAIENTPADFWMSNFGSIVTNLLNTLIRNANQSAFIKNIFPLVAPMLINTGHTSLGSMLDALFKNNTNTDNTPILFSSMIGLWQPTELLQNYQPTPIFTQGCNSIVSNIEFGNSVMPSLWDMIDRDIVEFSSVQNDIINASLALWEKGHYEESRIQKILKYLTPAQLAILAKNTEWDVKESTEALRDCWSYVPTIDDTNFVASVARSIFDLGPRGPQKMPEAAFSLWVEILGEQGDVSSFLLNNLDNYKSKTQILNRIWQLAFSCKSFNNIASFIALVQKFITYAEFANLSNTLDDKERIAGMLATTNEKQEMVQAIAEVFATIPSATVKASAAKLCEHLLKRSALRFFVDKQLTSDDIDILEKTFGNTKNITKLRDSIVTN